MAGVINTVLAMKRGLIPKHLNYRNPNPAMDWERLPLQVTATPMAWPTRSDRLPLAGVSGFGWSGTNAYVVLEGYATPNGASSSRHEGHWAAGPPWPIAVALPASVAEPPQPDHELAPRRTRFLPLSGKSDAALCDRRGAISRGSTSARRCLRPRARRPTPLLCDMAWTAAVGRSHFGHRRGVVFHDAQSLGEGLTALVEADAIAGQRSPLAPDFPRAT